MAAVAWPGGTDGRGPHDWKRVDVHRSVSAAERSGTIRGERMEKMEKLIAEVERRPALWDRSDPNYKNKFKVNSYWDAVAVNTALSKTEAKVKWKNLRDHFKKEVNKIPKSRTGDLATRYGGKWMFFHKMLFLKDNLLMRNVRTAAKLPEEEHAVIVKTDMEDDCEELFEDELHDKKSESIFSTGPSAKRKRKLNESKDSKQTVPVVSAVPVESRSFGSDESGKEDDDLSFFKSLLPYFKKLPEIRRLTVRNQFQTILINELSADPLQVSSFSDRNFLQT